MPDMISALLPFRVGAGLFIEPSNRAFHCDVVLASVKIEIHDQVPCTVMA